MQRPRFRFRFRLSSLFVLTLGVIIGLTLSRLPTKLPWWPPNEGAMRTLPTYVIEPPDILMINGIKIVPKQPYQLSPADGLLIRVDGGTDSAISGAYAIDAQGNIDLGSTYGLVRVAGMTVEEATAAVRNHLAQSLAAPQIQVSLAFSHGVQQITGEHLVGSDGRVNLGTYGSVYLTGLTIEEARDKIEQHLANYLEGPKITVDIFAYNSKHYYVISRTLGRGDSVTTAPITGNETVLDAVATIGGINPTANVDLWVARPSSGGKERILPVDWDQLSGRGSPTTNYQLFPGDRVIVSQKPAEPNN